MTPRGQHSGYGWILSCITKLSPSPSLLGARGISWFSPPCTAVSDAQYTLGSIPSLPPPSRLSRVVLLLRKVINKTDEGNSPNLEYIFSQLSLTNNFGQVP